MGTLEALRSATLETLLAVPGLSEIKARHIQTYLAQFPAVPSTKVMDRTKRSGKGYSETDAKRPSGNAAVLVQWETSTAPAPAIAPFGLEAARSLGAIIQLLLSANAHDLRNRLVSALECLAHACETVFTEGVTLPPDEAEKGLRRLRQLSESLRAAATHHDFDRKEQGRMATELMVTATWLASLHTPNAKKQGAAKGAPHA